MWFHGIRYKFLLYHPCMAIEAVQPVTDVVTCPRLFIVPRSLIMMVLCSYIRKRLGTILHRQSLTQFLTAEYVSSAIMVTIRNVYSY